MPRLLPKTVSATKTCKTHIAQLLCQVLDKLCLAAAWDTMKQKVHSGLVAPGHGRILLCVQEIPADLDDAFGADAALDV